MIEAKLTIRTGRGQDQLMVCVEDEISGQSLASFSLTPEQWYSLSGGAQLELTGKITSRLDRVGKAMQTDTEVYHRLQLSASTYEQMVEDAEQAAKADRPGWDTYAGRRNNSGGVVVVLRKWR